MKKLIFLFVIALSFLMVSCEEKPEPIPFEEFIMGIWYAEEGQMLTRINILNGTYVYQLEAIDANDVHVFPESTYTVDKMGGNDFLLFDNFSGGVQTARIKVIWDANDSNVMAWDRGENTSPLVFQRQLD